MFNVVRLEKQTIEHWNSILSQSKEAWFWHTITWLNYVKVIGAEFIIEDCSFLIYNEGNLIAICPLIVECRGGTRQFTYLGEFIPYPAFKLGICSVIREKALEFYAQKLEAIADFMRVSYARVTIPPLTQISSANKMQAWNQLLRYGYLDVSSSTQVIILDDTEKALWAKIRKGHRADIKRASENCIFKVWDKHTITQEKFDEYRLMHARDAGRVTRNLISFNIMRDWIREGTAVLFEAEYTGEASAFSLVILFGEGAYYASACKEPQFSQIPTMHMIHWETIRWLKNSGYKHYEIGQQHFGARWDHVPTEKEISIAHFKRGFGGVTVRMDMVERFYTLAALEQESVKRLKYILNSKSSNVFDPKKFS